MSTKLGILLDGVAQLEYDRSRELADDQKAFLKKIDADLDGGFELGGEHIEQPDMSQKSHCVAQLLVEAIVGQNEQRAAASCSWLATRIPDLKQVRATQQGDELSIELVFDQEYTNQVEVKLQ